MTMNISTDTLTPRATEELRRILERRRAEITTDLRHRVREVRQQGTAKADQRARDEASLSDAQIQDELELALLQMKSETLTKIDDALDRLDVGDYGVCRECSRAINLQRLQVLPFATRCRQCEEHREAVRKTTRRTTGWARVCLIYPDDSGRRWKAKAIRPV